jgi:hypothetical protein
MGVYAASNSGCPMGHYSFQTFPPRRTGLVGSFASDLIWGSTGTCIALRDSYSSNFAAGFLTYVVTSRRRIPHVRCLSQSVTYHRGIGTSHYVFPCASQLIFQVPHVKSYVHEYSPRSEGAEPRQNSTLLAAYCFRSSALVEGWYHMPHGVHATR